MIVTPQLIQTWLSNGLTNAQIQTTCDNSNLELPPNWNKLSASNPNRSLKSRKYSFRIQLDNWALLKFKPNKSKFLNGLLDIYRNTKGIQSEEPEGKLKLKAEDSN